MIAEARIPNEHISLESNQFETNRPRINGTLRSNNIRKSMGFICIGISILLVTEIHSVVVPVEKSTIS